MNLDEVSALRFFVCWVFFGWCLVFHWQMDEWRKKSTKIQLMRFHEAFYFTNPDIKKYERIPLFLAVSCSFACPIRRKKNCIARWFTVNFYFLCYYVTFRSLHEWMCTLRCILKVFYAVCLPYGCFPLASKYIYGVSNTYTTCNLAIGSMWWNIDKILNRWNLNEMEATNLIESEKNV